MVWCFANNSHGHWLQWPKKYDPTEVKTTNSTPMKTRTKNFVFWKVTVLGDALVEMSGLVSSFVGPERTGAESSGIEYIIC